MDNQHKFEFSSDSESTQVSIDSNYTQLSLIKDNWTKFYFPYNYITQSYTIKLESNFSATYTHTHTHIHTHTYLNPSTYINNYL